MTTRTRYFVIASLLVLTVGVGTGLVAYYVGLPDGVALQAQGEDLRLLPQNSHLVAHANVRRVVDSDLRQRLRTLIPMSGQGQRELLEQTGINIDTDIEEVLTSIAPLQQTASSTNETPQMGPLALARGRFDVTRLENLMQEKGAQAETYKNVKLLLAPRHTDNNNPSRSPDDFAVAFIEPDLAAIGSATLIRSAVDQRASGAGVTGNAALMDLIRSLNNSDLWAVGDFAALTGGGRLPSEIAGQLPGITQFAAAADVDSGVRGSVRADARDQASADDLRQVVQGLLALGRLQLRSRPELKSFLDSLVLGGSGNTVSLTFDIPPQLIDLLGAVVASGGRTGTQDSTPQPR
ncbi:MAG TPA: hypothetical protein VJP86_05120 [Vicinamibacterales bacterium]|nr:hypothetical protein [Vicinamibacterales bacterium]